jgi:hypothetical protein
LNVWLGWEKRTELKKNVGGTEGERYIYYMLTTTLARALFVRAGASWVTTGDTPGGGAEPTKR